MTRYRAKKDILPWITEGEIYEDISHLKRGTITIELHRNVALVFALDFFEEVAPRKLVDLAEVVALVKNWPGMPQGNWLAECISALPTYEAKED